jgi:hypothetical protein
MTSVPGQSNVNRLPRATCPECGRDVAVRRGGKLREHGMPNAIGVICQASGLTVAEAELEIERSLEEFRRSLR